MLRHRRTRQGRRAPAKVVQLLQPSLLVLVSSVAWQSPAAAQAAAPTPPAPAKQEAAPIRLAAAVTAAPIGADEASGARAAPDADAAGGSESSTIVVTASKVADTAKARLRQVPGTASIVLNSDVEKGRSANAQDLLALVPGVFAAATSGTSANKISIRGSGLATFYQGYSLGIRYLYDGLPFTGPGGTQEDLLNAAAVSYTEVLNGSNAFSYGAISLGGAINFVTRSGRSDPGVFLGAQFGSFGYRKYEGSFGGKTSDDKTDYYAYIAHNQRDGFQRNSPNSGEDYIVNFGNQVSDDLETRFIFRHRREDLVNGSTLTLAQIRADPHQTNVIAGRKKKGTTFLENRTTYTFGDGSKLNVGLAYNNFPLLNGWKTVAPSFWRSKDLTWSLRYAREGDDIFGLRSDTSLVYTDTRALLGDVTGYDVVNGANVFRQYTKYTGSHDTSWAINNNLHLVEDKLFLTTGLSLLNIGRNVRIERTIRTNATAYPQRVKYSTYDFAPRAGLLFVPAYNVQLFTNVTRSIDPPVTWQIGSTGNPFLYPLKPQKAWTGEAGVRATLPNLEASLTFYRTAIKHELLTIVVVPATPKAEAVTANANATPTIHQGIEAAAAWRLWHDSDDNKVTLRQSYTLNDFYYRHDPTYGSNDLPSLPRHFYQGALLFEQKVGFYLGVDLRYMSSYYVDFANTLKAPPTSIWGAKVGYQTANGWKAFVDLKNIGNKRYATATNTAFNLKGVDSPNFYVGDGFSIYGGVSIHF